MLAIVIWVIAKSYASQAQLATFRRWLELGGVKGIGTRFNVLSDRSSGVHLKWIANHELQPGEELFRVPSSLAMGSASLKRSPLGPALDQALLNSTTSTSWGYTDEGTRQRIKVLLHLIYDRFVARESSAFWPYLSLLPRELATAAYFNTAERAAFRR